MYLIVKSRIQEKSKFDASDVGAAYSAGCPAAWGLLKKSQERHRESRPRFAVVTWRSRTTMPQRFGDCHASTNPAAAGSSLLAMTKIGGFSTGPQVGGRLCRPRLVETGPRTRHACGGRHPVKLGREAPVISKLLSARDPETAYVSGVADLSGPLPSCLLKFPPSVIASLGRASWSRRGDLNLNCGINFEIAALRCSASRRSSPLAMTTKRAFSAGPFAGVA